MADDWWQARSKEYAFTQWPFNPWGNMTVFRMGYSVRNVHYRYTEYVSYNRTSFHGDWPLEGPSVRQLELNWVPAVHCP